MRALQRNKYVLGLEKSTKKLTKQWCKFLCQHWKLKKPHCEIEWVLGVVGQLKKLIGETCTAEWVLFPSVLWRLLVPLCTFSSGTSLTLPSPYLCRLISIHWKHTPLTYTPIPAPPLFISSPLNHCIFYHTCASDTISVLHAPLQPLYSWRARTTAKIITVTCRNIYNPHSSYNISILAPTLPSPHHWSHINCPLSTNAVFVFPLHLLHTIYAIYILSPIFLPLLMYHATFIVFVTLHHHYHPWYYY